MSSPHSEPMTRMCRRRHTAPVKQQIVPTMSTSLFFGKCDSLRMFDEMQTALDEIVGQAVEGVVDLAEAICPAIGDYLSWELTEPSLHFAFEEEVLPPNIATVFTTTPSVLLDWISAAQEIVVEHAARAA